jgi:hypothetical protein
LIFIPFFNVIVKGENMWVRHKERRLVILTVAVAGLTAVLIRLRAWDALTPILVVATLMFLAAGYSGRRDRGFRAWLGSKPLSFWVMTWFLMEGVTLTAVGTFFRGPGWSWVWPWSNG